jgi:hypothetical protein
MGRRSSRPTAGALFAAVLFAFLPATAAAQQTGNFCVRDFQGGAVCTANDVRVQALNLVNIAETCAAGIPGSALATFEVFVSAVGAPDRYDIGLFIALDGGSARDGNLCFHDFLEPPLTPTPAYGDRNGDGIPDLAGGPWWNADADACGDIASNTQLFKLVSSVRVACVDTNGDGFVDASVCTSWDNNTGTVCNGLADAFPGTNAKCGCERVETGIPMPGPTPPPSPSPSASPGPTPFPGPTPSPVPVGPAGALIGLAALLAAGGAWLLRRS